MESTFNYNIFVGTENGLLKGINTKTKSFRNLNPLENLSKEKEIFKMCWLNETEQDTILFGTKDNHIVKYRCKSKPDENVFSDLGCLDLGRGILKGFDSISSDKIMTCVESGSLKIWSLPSDESSVISELKSEIKAGQDINCAKKSKFSTETSVLIASGGKENDLKIWDVNKCEQPIFRAKNVADNWMQLREPVWVMCVDFVDQNKVAIGTAYHQVRVYDTKCGVRRPAFNLNYGQSPITNICSIQNDSNQLVVSNTRGDMEMIDLRMAQNKTGQCTTLKKYKSFHGTIKSMEIVNTGAYGGTTEKPFIATCGLDRFLRVHDLESSQLVSKVYLKSRSNCLLFSSHLPAAKLPAKQNDDGETKEEDEMSNVNSEDFGTDELWSDMETIVEKHPGLKNKKSKRMKDFSSASEEEQDDDDDDEQEEEEKSEFKKPKSVKKIKKNKKVK